MDMNERTPLTQRGSTAFDIDVDDLRHLMAHRKEDVVKLLHDRFGGLSGLCRSLKTSPTDGLTEDDFTKRKEKYNVNVIAKQRPKTFCELVGAALQDLTLIVLIVAAVISLALSLYLKYGQATTFDESEGQAGWIEGVAILIAVVVVVLVVALNDYQKEKQFRGLQSKIESEHTFFVIRKGETKQIPVQEILVGDVCQVFRYRIIVFHDPSLVGILAGLTMLSQLCEAFAYRFLCFRHVSGSLCTLSRNVITV
ncbi:cation transporter/ATPase [Opisthorchis viverrini]|uniref:P-type Ca(2+) transporter n=1 Tax=Opisthorchis viverrini TaxID=6198 RepID=A0A1S8X820_OPIVI|nr:cation transporter/ATPase [Opisthorchis viverrini]